MLWSLLFVCLLPVALSVSDHETHIDRHTCSLCPCFVKYSHRDIWIPKAPYSMAADGYAATLDGCLAACMDDKACSAVVYGIVGGREVYTCELYEDVDPTSAPRYTPHIYTYIKRHAMPCMVDYRDVDSVNLTKDPKIVNGRPVDRKHAYAKLYSKPNPFYWGRR